MKDKKPIKPLGKRAYGSIPHLPGSRRGPADKGLSEQQAAILTDKARDRHDVIIVQEKLDGSNVSVAKINGKIVPLIRAGYLAATSHYYQHHVFAEWVEERRLAFDNLLNEGERVVGEWLMEAHGTRYNLPHVPFVGFDLMTDNVRVPHGLVDLRLKKVAIPTPRILHIGGPMSIVQMLAVLEPSGHGAIDPVEGAVWRCERNGVVDFLGKYVRPDKEDGKYLNGVGGIEREPIYNWQP